MQCESCGTRSEANAQFCRNCGRPFAPACRQCGTLLPAGARFCPGCGKALDATTARRAKDRHDTTVLIPSRKQVTVLFGDVPDYTGMVGNLDAEEVHELMNALWARLDGIVTRHGGIVDKHIGDAIMALFGAKHAREEDPEEAVKAALEMLACLREFHPPSEGPPLRMRLGVHTGPVLLGPVGTKREFTATGDAVNLASRLEHEAPAGGVLISRGTYRHVCGLFDVRELPPLSIKGKDDPVQAYEVLRSKPRPLALRQRGIEGIERQMIGRHNELRQLQTGLESVIREQKCMVFTIVGEAGVGKSCLAQEFQKWVEMLPHHYRLFTGRAVAEAANVPFSLIRDVLCCRFDIQESDTAATARGKLECGITSFLRRPPATPGRILPHVDFVGQLVGFDFSDSPNLCGALKEPEQLRHRAFQDLGQFFSAVSLGAELPGDISPNQAAMLVLEDIHWSDDGSLDFIEFLGRACQHAPLLVICLARPTLYDRRPLWGGNLPSHTKLGIEALSTDDSRRLVETLLRKAPEVPNSLVDLIVARAEGNPFCIEEIIKMLIESKVILPDPVQWEIKPDRLTQITIPPTLAGVLQARVDGLTSAERVVLQRAAVVGRTFWDAALAHLTGPSEPMTGNLLSVDDVREALAGLRNRELVFQRREASAFAEAVEYTFKHELLREVAYETLLKRVRRHYHAQAAEWLIQRAGERVLEFAGAVGAHLEEAGQTAEAAEWFGRAGQQARLGYAPASAIDSLKKALELLPAAPATDLAQVQKRLEWQQALTEALGAQARFAEAMSAAEGALKLADRLGDPVSQATAWNLVAFFHERLGDNHESVRCAERARSLALDAGDGRSARGELIRSLHLKGWALYRLGDIPSVLAIANETLNLCRESSNRRGMATSFKLFGVAHLQLGLLGEAENYFSQGLALAQELDDRRTAAAMWSNLGEVARARGDFASAANLYEKALTLAREIGSRESQPIYLSNYGGARLGMGHYVEAEAALRQAIALSNESIRCSLAETYGLLSEACSRQGKFKEGWSTAERALALAKHSDNFLDMGGAWRALAEAAAGFETGGEPPPTRAAAAGPSAFYEESLRVYEHIDAQAEYDRTLQLWANYEARQGRPENSRQLLERRKKVPPPPDGDITEPNARPDFNLADGL